jgi:hypothetical protein
MDQMANPISEYDALKRIIIDPAIFGGKRSTHRYFVVVYFRQGREKT